MSNIKLKWPEPEWRVGDAPGITTLAPGDPLYTRAQVEEMIATLVRDAERLDWIETEAISIALDSAHCCRNIGTNRSAIDAEIAKELRNND